MVNDRRHGQELAPFVNSSEFRNTSSHSTGGARSLSAKVLATVPEGSDSAQTTKRVSSACHSDGGRDEYPSARARRLRKPPRRSAAHWTSVFTSDQWSALLA